MTAADLTIHWQHSQADIDREALTVLGASPVPVVTLGMLVLLDLLDSPLLRGLEDGAALTRETLLEAVYVVYRGRDAVEPVRRLLAGLEDEWYAEDASLPEAVEECVYDDGALEATGMLIRRGIEDALAGFSVMRPRASTGRRAPVQVLEGERSPSRRVFATPEYISGLLATLGGTALRVTMDELLWSVPMAAVSHGVAAAGAGQYDICRPRDGKATAEALRKLNRRDTEDNG